MKREGRQRGMIRSYPIVSPNPQTVINKLSSPPTAGLFTRASQKPTNHSKFTGKCGRPKCNSCHIHPATKSRDKAKGANKLRSHDVLSNYKLITWGLLDSASAFRLSGVSATGILDLLGDTNYYVDDSEDQEDVFQGSDDHQHSSTPVFQIEETNDDDAGNAAAAADHDDHDDDAMSFCDIDLVWEQMEDDDEDWCIVEEI